jgi:hypothetical protein
VVPRATIRYLPIIALSAVSRARRVLVEKLRLDLDGLSVESFDTGRGDRARGTVNAHAYTNTRPTCHYHCTYLGPTCEVCIAP